MQTIEAKVSPRILKKAKFLFNQSPKTLLHELLQNSRRAGATQIEFELTSLHPTSAGTMVILRDNGEGISDPQNLLHLGESGWNAEIQGAESPAGMGFFSLCHLPQGVEIHSQNWKAKITPEAFEGGHPIEIKAAPHLTGTELRFTLEETLESLSHTLEGCCHYFPIPVRLNKRTLKQTPFLQSTSSKKEISGATLGICLTRRDHIFNFYGLTLVQDVERGNEDKLILPHQFPFSISVDIQDNACVDLVLPSRDKIVENQKLEILQAECRRFAYEYIARTKMPHRLSYKYFSEAKLMGISLPEATPYLRPVNAGPLHSDYDLQTFEDYDTQKVTITSETDAILFNGEDSDIVALMLASLQHEEKEPFPCFLQGNDRFLGYSWYPKKTVTKINFVLVKNKKEELLDTQDSVLPKGFITTRHKTWPDKIYLRVESQTEDGKTFTRDFPCKFAFCDGGYQGCEDKLYAQWLLPKGCEENDIKISIRDALVHIFFDNDEDSDKSFNTQEEEFNEEIRNVLALIFSGEKAQQLQIVESNLDCYELHRALKRLKAREVLLKVDTKGNIIGITINPKSTKKKP